MKLSKLVPPPFREFLRQRLTVYVYTYGFRPSKSIAEQTFTFVHSGHSFSVKADHRTALYDMIAEVVDYDCYQLNKLDWESGRDRYIVDIGAEIEESLRWCSRKYPELESYATSQMQEIVLFFAAISNGMEFQTST